MYRLNLLGTFTAIACLACCGCGGISDERVVGTWECTLILDEEVADWATYPGQEKKGEVPLSLVLGSDGTWKMSTPLPDALAPKKDGKFKILSRDGDALKIRLVDNGGGKAEFNVTFETDDEFSTADFQFAQEPAGTKVFRRIESESAES